MTAVDEGDVVTPQVAWHNIHPGRENYSDKCDYSRQFGSLTA